MKRNMYLWLAGIVLAGMCIPSLRAQNAGDQKSSAQNPSAQAAKPAEPSLGNYARELKKEKKQQAAKRFDNDNLPREDKLSVVGPAAESADSSGAAAPEHLAASGDAKAAEGNKPAMPTVTPGESQQERQQVYDQWKEKLSSQQSQVDSLARELDLEQREYKLRAASFYGDAGERLRNEAGWDKEDAEYKKKLADAQKALDDAKQKMSDMQEDARKAGVPASVREGEQPQQ